MVRSKTPFEFNFTMLNKGYAFKIRSCWKIINFDTPTYFISFYNSYRINVVKPWLEYRPLLSTSIYCGCCIKCTQGVFPDLIIQPKSLTSIVMNFIFHYDVKIQMNQDFNRKYIIQSTERDKIQLLLTTDFFDAVGSVNDLHIEIKNSKCLIYFIRPAREGDGDILLNAAKELIAIVQRNGC